MIPGVQETLDHLDDLIHGVPSLELQLKVVGRMIAETEAATAAAVPPTPPQGGTGVVDAPIAALPAARPVRSTRRNIGDVHGCPVSISGARGYYQPRPPMPAATMVHSISLSAHVTSVSHCGSIYAGRHYVTSVNSFTMW